MRITTFVIVSLLLPWASVTVHGQDVTFTDLTSELTGLERLTTAPRPPYKNAQFSSYDRKSTDPEAATDENWFANDDRGQFIREEQNDDRTEYVMAEMDGPGAIVRIWSANPNDAGTVRFYLDGADEPVIEMPLQELLSGDHEHFPAPLCGVRARGWNSYVPIPYAKSCKITASEPNFYYHVNYRTYDDDASLQTYSATAAQENLDALKRAADTLTRPDTAAELTDTETAARGRTLAPNQSKVLFALNGPGAVRRFTCRIEAADKPEALRKNVLTIAFDNDTTVRVPLGDFFGTAPGLNSYESITSGVRQDGTMYANWVMPFANQAVIRLHNNSEQTIRVHAEAHFGDAPPDWNYYFHAAYRVENDIPTQPRQDWTYLQTEGPGRFVGNVLHVANPTTAWWGEGDEKIYVDGENFPSTFGTGTEDYYGYAWTSPERFTHAYHNQPRCDGPANYGHTNVSRFHLIDDIPFNESFKFDMEIWHWEEVQVSYASTSYWYGPLAAHNAVSRWETADLNIPEIPPKRGVEGAIEGEQMRVINASHGNVVPQYVDQWGWSRGGQVWWRDAQQSATLKLGFPMAEAGKYRIEAVFTEAYDYAIAQMTINGQQVFDEPRDFYYEDVRATDPIDLGVFELRQGENIIEVTLTGMNDNAEKLWMWGLDYIKPTSANKENEDTP